MLHLNGLAFGTLKGQPVTGFQNRIQGVFAFTDGISSIYFLSPDVRSGVTCFICFS